MSNPRGKTLDQKIMGNCPKYFGVIFPTEKERKLALIKGLAWHGFYLSITKDFKIFEEFVQINKLCTKDQIVAIRGASEYLPPTILSLIQMSNDGWILNEKEWGQIKASVKDLASRAPNKASDKNETKTTNTSVEPTPQILRKEVVSIYQIFDLEEERWFTEKRIPIDSLENFTKSIFDAKLSQKEYNDLTAFLETRLEEYNSAYHKTDPDLVEGYSKFGQRLLGASIKRINMFISGVKETSEKVKTIQKARRISKPRTKKSGLLAADAQLKHLKFLPSSAELNLPSIDPRKIVGAKIMVTYNVKYKIASIFHSATPDGFSIKGTTLQNFNLEKSKAKGIRKPAEVVPFLKNKTLPQIEVLWGNLTTVERPAKGRINEDTLLLRVI